MTSKSSTVTAFIVHQPDSIGEQARAVRDARNHKARSPESLPHVNADPLGETLFNKDCQGCQHLASEAMAESLQYAADLDARILDRRPGRVWTDDERTDFLTPIRTPGLGHVPGDLGNRLLKHLGEFTDPKARDAGVLSDNAIKAIYAREVAIDDNEAVVNWVEADADARACNCEGCKAKRAMLSARDHTDSEADDSASTPFVTPEDRTRLDSVHGWKANVKRLNKKRTEEYEVDWRQGNTMSCPECSSEATRLDDDTKSKRPKKTDGIWPSGVVLRHHKCEGCGHEFLSLQAVVAGEFAEFIGSRTF